jgi:hypothetical protein
LGVFFFVTPSILTSEERCAHNEVAVKYFPEDVLTLKNRSLRCAPFEFVEKYMLNHNHIFATALPQGGRAYAFVTLTSKDSRVS